jgi:predicted RNA methylase
MTHAVQDIEERRQQEQVRLDALKTAEERNKWGQFATPPLLAVGMARYARKLMGGGAVRFLDPAIGTGSFYSAVRQVFPEESILAAQGVELDPLFAETAKRLWGEELTVVNGDFTRQQVPEERFNLVLTNPPYVRHHHLAASDKEHLKARLARSLRLEISGLAGLYCYFLLLAHDWMEDGGLGVWLVPSEFMDVNYGVTVRRYLTTHVTLLHIHRFSPTDAQFDDALVSSAVVVFRKAAPTADHKARFSFGGTVDAPKTEASVPIGKLRRSQKWTQFPGNNTVRTGNGIVLGDLFSIKRGLATGANSFFVLTEDTIRAWAIPRQFLKPILPGPRRLTDDVVEPLPDGAPKVSPVLYLLDCSEPEERIKTMWPRFYEYLQQGRGQNVHASYLASRRAPWYSQERRPPAPFLCTYMGRAGKHKDPFRFIWNRSQATAHNVYLMLYPKARLAAALREHPELAQEVFGALKRITPKQLVSEGRVYGGGLHKVEPNELAHIPARPILESIERHVRIEEQLPMLFA